METFKIFRQFSLLDRKKADPEQFTFTGDTPPVEKIEIQLFKYTEKECVENQALSPERIEKLEHDGYTYWLNIHGINEPEVVESICDKQQIHSLVIQDILDVNQRPKFQEFDDYSFLTLKSILPSGSEVLAEQISMVFSQNFLISFQERKADYFEHLRYRLREDKGVIRERGADYLLYALLESILDNYFKTLGKLDDDIEKLSFTDTREEPSPDALQMIEGHKKFVHYIKKSILPIKEFALIVERGECQFIEHRHVKYFLEIKDLCLTLLDNCDMLMASLESNTNLFFSVQGHRMNKVMKTLTVVAAIFIPLTFLAGVYGMNFTHMPELEWEYAYFTVWAVFLLIFVGMVFYFRKMKWF